LVEKNNLRVMFIAGGLGNGGAEKQFLYMLRALKELKATSQVITLTQGEFYDGALSQMGIRPVYAGANPAARMAVILRSISAFRPHFVQATHFFASFYAGAAGRLRGVTSIGAIRSDLYLDLEGIGKAGPWRVRLPSVLLANSKNARENALRLEKLHLRANRVHVLQNVIDLEDFDHRQGLASPELLSPDCTYAMMVARLVPVKRMERFLIALSEARQQVPNLVGIIAGDGPELPNLRALAETLGLRPNQPNGGIWFLGERQNIPQLLNQAHIFVLTSDREGFPNVLLEAMAASLPIVATPAGETPELVQDGANGYLVPFDDPRPLVEALVRLARSPALRRRMGNEGRRVVEYQYSFPRLKSSLVDTYQAIALQAKDQNTLSALENGGTMGRKKISPLP
jgi:glycosyltransferase involved in cell wall biosynthesis